jgi:hypothetical protein
VPNTVAPFGFRPIRRQDGAAWSGNFTQCKGQPTAGALNRGDLVQQMADGTVAVGAAAVGYPIRGVYDGCHYLLAALGYNIWSNYWPGSGAIGLVDIFVIDDPSVVFEGQASAGPITLASVGLNADVVVTASTTGFSKWALGVPAATATFPFRVERLGNGGVYISDGYDATAANNIVEVSWNSMFMRQSGTGV